MDNTPLDQIIECLQGMLEPEERMLVSFNGKVELIRFVSKTGCTEYHSDLYKPGNMTKEYIHCWDLGGTKVMVSTTRFAQGGC